MPRPITAPITSSATPRIDDHGADDPARDRAAPEWVGEVRRALREGAPAVVLVGSDLPELATTDLQRCLILLREHPLVLGPAYDGGYWLIGLAAPWPALFAGGHQAIAWGSDRVLQQTLTVAAALGLQPILLPLRGDLDHAIDLARWR